MARQRRTFGRPGKGQGLIEFAVILPIFMLLLMILFDFGRVVYALNAISQNTHAATRYASVEAPKTNDEIRARAKLVPPAVDLPNSAITGEAGPDDFYPDGTEAGDRVVVKISIPVPLITPIISSIVGGSITVSSRSEDTVR